MIRILKILFGLICAAWGIYVITTTATLVGTVAFAHLFFSWLFGFFCFYFGIIIFAEGIKPNKINSSD